MAHSERFRFLGMNIKGTPAMSATKVLHDLRVGMKRSDVLVVQEFRWPWYWRQLAKTVPNGWLSAPGRRGGLAKPTYGAQAVIWNNKKWKRVDVRSHILHRGVARISEDRHIRGVLLEDRKSGYRCWFATTHFVVGGDERTDSTTRRAMMTRDLKVFAEFIKDIKKIGHPVLFQGDLNIHKDSWAHKRLMEIVDELDLKIHGIHGVEYLFSTDSERCEVQVHGAWTVPTSLVNTDHEGRGVDFTLEG